MRGWVYVITNKAMPGLVKVGFSLKDPELRANELDGTGSAQPYLVEYEVLVDEPRSIEQQAHAALSRFRERKEKEWFRCSCEEAVAAIKSIVKSDALIENHKRVDREKAEVLRREKEAEAKRKRAENEARERTEEQRKKKESLVQEQDMQIHTKYDELLKATFPEKSFWAYYWISFFTLGFIAISIVRSFPKLQGIPSIAIFLFAAFGARFVAIFWEDYLEKQNRKSPKYRTLIQKRDAELEALNLISLGKIEPSEDEKTVVLCPKCKQKLRIPKNKRLVVNCSNCANRFEIQP